MAGEGRRAAAPSAAPAASPAPRAGRARGSLRAGSAGSGTKPFCECHPGEESCISAAARAEEEVKESLAGGMGVEEEEPTEERCLKLSEPHPEAQPVRRAGVRVGLTNGGVPGV